MLLELRKLTIIEALFEETACYTAQIWNDGALAFAASNRGQVEPNILDEARRHLVPMHYRLAR